MDGPGTFSFDPEIIRDGCASAGRSADAEDGMPARSNDAIVRNATEPLVMDTLLLEIGGVIMISADHNDTIVCLPIVCLRQPTGYLVEDLLIVSGLLEAKTAVPGND